MKLELSFKIPKINRSLLTEITDFSEIVEILKEILVENQQQKTFLDKMYLLYKIKLTKIECVSNKLLEYNYAKRYQSMILNKNANTKLRKRIAFYQVQSTEELNDIIKFVFECQISTDDRKNILNHSEGGFHFSRYLDVALKHAATYSDKKEFVAIVVVEMLIKDISIKNISKKKIEEFCAPIEYDTIVSHKNCNLNQPLNDQFANSLIYKYDIVDGTYSRNLQSVIPTHVLHVQFS